MSGSRVEAVFFAPTRRVADAVERFWAGSWDLRGQAPHTTRLLGDPCIHIVFEHHDGKPPAARLVGVWTRTWTRSLEEHGWVRAAKLRAGAASAFLEEDAVRYTNRMVDLAAMFDPDDVAQTAHAVLAPDNPREGIAHLEGWIAARMRPLGGGAAEVITMVDRIQDDPEITRVDDLARAAGYDPRSLQRLFRRHLGASPKWTIRRRRLQEAALRLERGDEVSLSRLAHDLGYSDQAHLARDFTAAVGTPPSRFARSVHADPRDHRFLKTGVEDAE